MISKIFNSAFEKNLFLVNSIKKNIRKISDEPTFRDFLNEAKTSSCSTENLKAVKGQRLPLPEWLKTPIPIGSGFFHIDKQLKEKKIATVCQEARCPNIGECWSDHKDNVKTATILVLGDTCTRGCRFCSIKTSKTPPPPNPDEPKNTAEAIASWNVGYIVITTVDRDDLPDGGSHHLAQTVIELKKLAPEILIECLTSDYQGIDEYIDVVANSGLHVYAHNIETVDRLQTYVRDPRASYRQTLHVLERAKITNPKLITKSSIMVGFGETDSEIKQTMIDLRNVGVQCLTIGQYMQPTRRHAKVKEYVNPEKFKEFEKLGIDLGFLYVASGPLVRSSYKAGEYYMKNILKSMKA